MTYSQHINIPVMAWYNVALLLFATLLQKKNIFYYTVTVIKVDAIKIPEEPFK
jgi:hypothetical protein